MRALIGLCLLVMSHLGQILDPWHSQIFTIAHIVIGLTTYPFFYSSKVRCTQNGVFLGCYRQEWVSAPSGECSGTRKRQVTYGHFFIAIIKHRYASRPGRHIPHHRASPLATKVCNNVSARRLQSSRPSKKPSSLIHQCKLHTMWGKLNHFPVKISTWTSFI